MGIVLLKQSLLDTVFTHSSLTTSKTRKLGRHCPFLFIGFLSNVPFLQLQDCVPFCILRFLESVHISLRTMIAVNATFYPIANCDNWRTVPI